MSPDRRQSVVVIAFIGSVFSPYYFAERSNGGIAEPLDFCAFNVAIYNEGKRVWGFTEWPRERVDRQGDTLRVGDNRITYHPDRIVIDIDEARVTGRGRIEGAIVIHPRRTFDHVYPLIPTGVHRWQPVAPLSDVEVILKKPSVRFVGSGYHDRNDGDEPLEASLNRWSWSRHEIGDATVVLYDGLSRDEGPFSLALRFSGDAAPEALEPPPAIKLPRTFWWRCPRESRSDNSERPRIIRTLEDTPFYARTILECKLLGKWAPGIHESLSLDTFATRWMQWMLPFRLKRAR